MPDSIIKLDLEAGDVGPPQGDTNPMGTWILYIVFFGSLVIGLFYEYPNVWLMSIQLGLPWVAVGLALCFPKRYRLFPEFALPVGDQEPRPSLSGTFFISLCSVSTLGPMSIPSDVSIVLIFLLAAALGGATVLSEQRAEGNHVRF